MKTEFKPLHIFKIYAFSIIAVLSLLLTFFAFSIILAKSKSSVPSYESLQTITAPIDSISLVKVESIGPMGLFRLEGDSANYRISGMPYTLLDTTSFKNLKKGDSLSVRFRIQETKKGMMFKDLVYWLNFRDVWELKTGDKTILNYKLSKIQVDLFNKNFLKWMYPLLALFIVLTLVFGFLTFKVLRNKSNPNN